MIPYQFVCIQFVSVILALFRRSIGFAHIGRVGSVFVTISVSLERFMSVRKPNTNYFFKKLFLPMSIAFALLYNVPKFFEFATCDRENDIRILPVQMSLPYQTEKLMTSKTIERDIPILSNDSNPYPIKLDRINDMLSKIYSNKQNSSRRTKNNVDCKNKLYGVTKLRKNQWYIILYVFGSEVIFIEILPWITIVILNVLTWKGIQEFERNRKRFIRSHSIGSFCVNIFLLKSGIKW